MRKYTRREVIRALGVGAAAVGVSAGATVLMAEQIGISAKGKSDRGLAPSASGGMETATDDLRHSAEAKIEPWELMAPSKAGEVIGGYRLMDIEALNGIVRIDFESVFGGSFSVKVGLRDDTADAPLPIARTRHLDFFMVNGGKGSKATDEKRGRFVMQLSSIVEGNYRDGVLPLETLRSHWARG